MFRSSLAVAVAAVLVLPAALRADDATAEAANSYTIETGESTKETKAGGKGKLVVHIHPKGEVKVKPEAPLKMKLEGPAAIKLEKAQYVRKDAVDPRSYSPKFEVPFTATTAGTHEVKANVSFFVCKGTDWCIKQDKAVTLAVNVK